MKLLNHLEAERQWLEAAPEAGLPLNQPAPRLDVRGLLLPIAVVTVGEWRFVGALDEAHRLPQRAVVVGDRAVEINEGDPIFDPLAHAHG